MFLVVYNLITDFSQDFLEFSVKERLTKKENWETRQHKFSTIKSESIIPHSICFDITPKILRCHVRTSKLGCCFQQKIAT